MAWIAAATIGSAALGAYGANQSRKSQDKATAASQQGFNQYKPYVDANLAGSQSALDGVIGQGAYTGQTYAGPNDFQTGTANTMGTYGANMMNAGNNMMGDNSGFGANSRGLYDQFQGMGEDARADRLGIANSYAANNSGALVDSAMRDDRRNLQENTLTGIDLAASGSGNMNSSRAGVAEAVANRGYEDRRADVTMDIQDRLVDRSLNSQARQFADQGTALTSAMNANSGISDAYKTGMNTLGEGANFGMNAGNSLQGYNQAGLNDARRRFEEERDFELNTRKGYQSGVLGQSPDSKAINATTASPIAGALSGGMAGFGFMKEHFPGQFERRPNTRGGGGR
jgi:hypothetical protein